MVDRKNGVWASPCPGHARSEKGRSLAGTCEPLLLSPFSASLHYFHAGVSSAGRVFMRHCARLSSAGMLAVSHMLILQVWH